MSKQGGFAIAKKKTPFQVRPHGSSWRRPVSAHWAARPRRSCLISIDGLLLAWRMGRAPAAAQGEGGGEEKGEWGTAEWEPGPLLGMGLFCSAWKHGVHCTQPGQPSRALGPWDCPPCTPIARPVSPPRPPVHRKRTPRPPRSMRTSSSRSRSTRSRRSSPASRRSCGAAP